MDERSTKNEVERRIVQQLYAHAPAAIFATMVNSALLAFVYRDVVSGSVLYPWLVASIGFLAVRYAVAKKGMGVGFTTENYRFWLRLFVSTAVVSGAIFGAPGVLFISVKHITYNAFLYVLMGGMFAGAMGAFAIKKAAFFAYAVPLFAPITVHFFVLGGELHTAMGTLGVIFTAMMISLTFRMNKSLVSAFELSIQNELLAAEMKHLNDDLRNANEELTRLSLYDSLTNTKNRRFISDILRPETERFAFSKQKIQKTGLDERDPAVQVYGIFVVDIDHFKRVNDTYGHAAGDVVLKQFVEILQGMIRRDDVLVRWGGEEFVVVLKRTRPEYLGVFAGKVVKSVEEAEFRVTPDTVISKTCSVGYTTFPFVSVEPLALSLEQSIDIADRALYQAKNTGRNKAVFAKYDPGDSERSGHAKKLANIDAALAARLIKMT